MGWSQLGWYVCKFKGKPEIAGKDQAPSRSGVFCLWILFMAVPNIFITSFLLLLTSLSTNLCTGVEEML